MLTDQVIHWQDYAALTDSIDWLKSHRDWVEEHKWGFGDRPLHYMWYVLLQTLPDEARLLEIGVFKGQVISLWSYIGEKLAKDFQVYGITPLNREMKDSYHTHEIVTRKDIQRICDRFKVSPNVINADSTDPDCPHVGELDLLYIDGGHDYNTVMNDIAKFTPDVKVGGIVVFDDASLSLPDFGHWYKGLQDVSEVADNFALRTDYEEFLTVGHNRCFRKLA